MITSSNQLIASEPPKVLASIKPVQLIAQAVTSGITDVDILLPPGASPHNHSLKPSDARKLYNTDAVFWVGPDMEMFLEKILASNEHTLSVPLMIQSRLQLQKTSDHEDVHEHEEEHEHHHGEYDPHTWLSPTNAMAMAATIADKLSMIDPEHKQQYKSNLKRFSQKLQEADRQNVERLASFHQRPMFVFHDAYGYLQTHYQLNIAGHFTLNPEQQPGAKHLAMLRSKLKKAGNSCVFREPQFKPAYIDRIIEGTEAKVAVLDPLASNVSVSAKSYIDFLNGLVSNIVNCLK